MNLMFTPDMTPAIRKQMLEDNADKVEETTYQKPLTQDELDLRREQLSDKDIELSELEDEKKEIISDLKFKMDAVKNVKKGLRTEIKSKQVTVSGKLFHVANHTNGMMESYDEDGNMISSRRLRPDEKQARFFMSKAQ